MPNLQRRGFLAATGGLTMASAVQSQATQPAGDPVRGKDGAGIVGPVNPARQAEEPNTLRPPSTDHGTMPNLKWSFADSHMRLEEGGWARQTTIRDVGEGDLWYFPGGIPHSIQGLDSDVDGVEFLLVFDDGAFSEDSTLLITDWLAHTPPDVLAKNLGTSPDRLAKLPLKERYIFPAAPPASFAQDSTGGAGPVPETFAHRMTAQEPQQMPGGTVRITDTSNFPASRTIAAALVELEPGALRELHWHPAGDEWQYYLAGQGRMTVLGSEGKARTFDYQGGDVGYVPFAMGHYVENTGNDTLRYLEVFRSSRYSDVSLNQWMKLTPSELVRSHLNIDQAVLDGLSAEKRPVLPARRG